MELPTDRITLMQLIQEERGRLEETIKAMSDAQLSEPGLDGGWSAKDALAHLVF